jgi:hypothetical protein
VTLTCIFILLITVSYVKDKNFSNGVDWDKLQASELSTGSFNSSLSQEFLYCRFVHPNTLFSNISDLTLGSNELGYFDLLLKIAGVTNPNADVAIMPISCDSNMPHNKLRKFVS